MNEESKNRDDDFEHACDVFEREDYKEFFKWCRKSAEMGFIIAQLELGYLYNEGHGVEQDDHEAIKWRLRAAEQGNQFVARNLGGHYAGGYGVEKNDVQAYKWFSIAAINGDEDSQKYKQRLEEEMTPIQVAEAQELARKWMEKFCQ